jgi:uncharacterized protein (DUF1499 family)
MNLFGKITAWFTINDVTAGESKYYPELEPITLEGPFDRVFKMVKEAFENGGDRWTTTEVSSDDQRLTGTVETDFFGFVDDFEVTVKNTNSNEANRWTIIARSSSRIGRGDFGQNARNIRNFYRRLRDLSSKN